MPAISYTPPNWWRRFRLRRGWAHPRSVFEAVLFHPPGGAPPDPWPADLPQPSPASGGQINYTDGSWINIITGDAKIVTEALAAEIARRGWTPS